MGAVAAILPARARPFAARPGWRHRRRSGGQFAPPIACGGIRTENEMGRASRPDPALAARGPGCRHRLRRWFREFCALRAPTIWANGTREAGAGRHGAGERAPMKRGEINGLRRTSAQMAPIAGLRSGPARKSAQGGFRPDRIRGSVKQGTSACKGSHECARSAGGTRPEAARPEAASRSGALATLPRCALPAAAFRSGAPNARFSRAMPDAGYGTSCRGRWRAWDCQRLALPPPMPLPRLRRA